MFRLFLYAVRVYQEEQPNGPYRLSAFSATSLIAIALTKMFEANGDSVSQLALLDHLPTMFFCPVYGLDRAFDDRRAFHRVCMQGICDALRRDGGGKIPRRHQLANELWDSFEGRPAPEFAEGYWKTVEKFLNLMVDFMVKEDRNLVEWMGTIKAPVSVYMASEGMVGTLPEEYREEWADLGMRLSFPDGRTIPINGGHFDILADEKLVQGLQEGYL